MLLVSFVIFNFYYLLINSFGEGMAPHSSTLAWKIPWIEEHGGLKFTGLQRVGLAEQLTHTRTIILTKI